MLCSRRLEACPGNWLEGPGQRPFPGHSLGALLHRPIPLSALAIVCLLLVLLLHLVVMVEVCWSGTIPDDFETSSLS